MTKTKTRSIHSFAGLLKMVESHRSGHFIYRGENQTTYSLRPKVGRSVRFPDVKDSAEKDLLAEFVRRGVTHIDNPPSNAWEWLALGQHYGLATRFLDWSENALVAAFFALMSPTWSMEDRVIYALPYPQLDRADVGTSPFAISKVATYWPKHISPRIVAQQGVFTVHPEPDVEFEHESLERWVIKGKAVIDLGIRLDMFGFNRATMFPGLDGLCFHINDWWLSN